MSVVAERLDFYPPPEHRTTRSYVLALIAHAFLLAALTWGVHWQRAPEPNVVEAELWSTVFQQAAPKLQEVAPPPPPPPPPPAPKPEPVKPVKVPEARKPEPEAPDPQIAIEKERKRLEKLEREQEKKLQEELKKAELAEKKRLEQERKEQERLEREEKKRLEALEKERQRQEAEAKERARQEAIAAAERAAQRASALARISGIANASGGPTAVGTAAQSTGPSSGYGALVNAAVRPNIVYTAENNPEAVVLVLTTADGTVRLSRLIRPSGSPAWDAAVLRAIEKTGKMPKDRDGQVPEAITREPGLEITFRR